MKNTLILLTLLSLAFVACKTTQYTPNDFKGDQIMFGSGGGITGSYTYYTLLENGQLFKNGKQKGQYTELKKISRDQVNQLFDNYKVLDLANVNYDEPDNMSYFIEYKTEEKVHRIVYGGAAKGLKTEAKLFYQFLNELVQPSKK